MTLKSVVKFPMAEVVMCIIDSFSEIPHIKLLSQIEELVLDYFVRFRRNPEFVLVTEDEYKELKKLPAYYLTNNLANDPAPLGIRLKAVS